MAQAVRRIEGSHDLGALMRDADLLALYRLWSESLQGRIAPRRDEIDPTRLPASLLPKMFIVQLGDCFENHRCTLAGTALRGWIGIELTHKRFGELPIALWQEARKSYDTIGDTAQPYYRTGLPSRFDQTRSFDKLLLPLSENGLSVTRVVGAMSPRLRRPGQRSEADAAASDAGLLPTTRV